MKRPIIALLFLLSAIPAAAQMNFTGSMGINYFSAPSLKDYLNMNYPASSGLVPVFSSAIGFYGEFDIPVSGNYEVGFEYEYGIYSYNSPSSSGGNYSFSIDMHKINLIGYYVISEEWYKLKFGAGGGIRMASVDEEIYYSANYKTTGFGFVTKVNGLTPLSANVFVNLGVEAGYDFTGEPESGGNKIINAALNKNVNLNEFTLGLKIGVTYFF